jgi:hypothetical protein
MIIIILNINPFTEAGFSDYRWCQTLYMQSHLLTAPFTCPIFDINVIPRAESLGEMCKFNSISYHLVDAEGYKFTPKLSV